MELLVHLQNSGDLAQSEARDVIARLQRQNITQYQLIPNDTSPTAIQFEYDGRVSHGQSVEPSNRQYNDVRDGGTFVSMDQVLQAILINNGKKKGNHMYAKVPIHLRTRSLPGQPSQDLHKTIVRTITSKTKPAGSWIVLLQHSQYQKHLYNNASPTLPDPNDIKQKLGLTEDISIINNNPNIEPSINLNTLNSQNNDININPQDSNGDISIPKLNRMYNLQTRKNQLDNKKRR